MISATLSTIEIDHIFGAPADGTAHVTLTVTVRDVAGNPVAGQVVSLSATGTGNNFAQPPSSNVNGVSIGTLASSIPEIKTISATVNPGPNQVVLVDTVQTEFIVIPPLARYVTPDGDNSNSGTSPIDAWRTISHAASVLQPGETVHVRPGTYAESVDVLVSGTSDRPIVFRGDTDGCFTGVAGRVEVNAGGGMYGFRFSGRDFVLVRGFTVVGAVSAGLPGGAFLVENQPNTNLVFLANEAYGNGRGFWIDQATDVVLEGNRISNNQAGTGEGVVLVGVTGAQVVNNLIYNNAGIGLDLRLGSMDVNVQLNTLFANLGDQVAFSDSGTVATLMDNVISQGGNTGLRLPAPDSVDDSANLVWGHAGSDIETGGGAPPPVLNADPEFLNPAGPDGLLGGANGLDDDFRLDTASPAMDAGSGNARSTRLPVSGAVSGTTNRIDGVPDGTSPDGLKTNLGHHTPLAPEGMDPIVTGDARLVWSEGGDVQLRARSWDDSVSGWGPTRMGTPSNRNIEWVVHRASPGSGYEIIATLSDLGTSTDLVVRHWDGRKWNDEDPFDPIESSILPADSNQRGFDVEFESISGQGMLVSANGTSNPVFRVFEDGLWSSESDIFAAAPATGRVLWTELVARHGTDELALVMLTQDSVLSAAVWNGNSWENAPTVLDNVITTTRSSQAFDVAFEDSSGDLLVVWGHTALIEEARFAERNSSNGVWTNGLIPAAEATCFVVRLASERGTNRIVGGFAEDAADDDSVAFIWDGSTFVHIVEFDLNGGQNQRDIAVGWAGTSGVAIVAWKDNDGGGTVSWGRFSNGWRRQADLNVPGFGDQEFAQARSHPTQDRLMLVVADETGTVFGLDYDGTNWTLTNGGQALATGLELTNASARPFDFDFRR